MAVECTINVGFHSNFGTFRQSEYSKTSLRSAIINEIPFNPTYELTDCVRRKPNFQEITLRLREQGCWSRAFMASVRDVLFTFLGAFTGQNRNKNANNFRILNVCSHFSRGRFPLIARVCGHPNVNKMLTEKKIDILRFFLLPRILPFSPKDFAKVLVDIFPTVLYAAASDVSDFVPLFSSGKR